MIESSSQCQSHDLGAQLKQFRGYYIIYRIVEMYSSFGVETVLSSDSSKALLSKTVEHLMLASGLKTGCQLHFGFRSYGGKTLPDWPKGAEIRRLV
jgi:hypothetical protein